MTGPATATTPAERAAPPRETGRARVVQLWASAAWAREAVLVGVVNELYEVTRSLAPTRVTQAFANARMIERLEQAVHLNPEWVLNLALLDVSVLIPPISVYYQVGHLVALLAALVWAWRRHRDRYRPARNALLLLTLTALAGYWLAPTAPPRFAMTGMVDAVAMHPVLLASHENVVGLVNEYAAMPSLHVAWAVWVALVVTGLSGRRRIRWVGWAHPVATTLVVLATANHYLLDAVAGAVLTFAAWWLVGTGRRTPLRWKWWRPMILGPGRRLRACVASRDGAD